MPVTNIILEPCPKSGAGHREVPLPGFAAAILATATLAGFPDRFEWALDDLRALVSGHPVIAEGWGLRPELVAPIIDSPCRMVVMVPTPEFRRHQLQELPRAASLGHRVSDPARAQANRLTRDRLAAEHARGRQSWKRPSHVYVQTVQSGSELSLWLILR